MRMMLLHQAHVQRFTVSRRAPKKSASVGPESPNNAVPLFLNGRKLRDYQLASLEWMVHNMKNGINCILGDEVRLDHI